VRAPFNAALAPGPKTFDANLFEFSITEQRKVAVDFSSHVTQAVVTVRSSPAAGVKTVQQLKRLRLGVQVGTTSYTAATSVGGDVPVEVYNTNGDAKMALSNGEIDALVADLPTAFAVANELRNGLMVGQLPSASNDVEQFGIVLDKAAGRPAAYRGRSRRFAVMARWAGWNSSGSPTRARRPCLVSWLVPAPATSTPPWRRARCPGRLRAADRRPDPARQARRARSGSGRNHRVRSVATDVDVCSPVGVFDEHAARNPAAANPAASVVARTNRQTSTGGRTDAAPARRRRRRVPPHTPGRRPRRCRRAAWPRLPARPTCCVPTRR